MKHNSKLNVCIYGLNPGAITITTLAVSPGSLDSGRGHVVLDYDFSVPKNSLLSCCPL